MGGEIYVHSTQTENLAMDVYYGMGMLDLELPAGRILGFRTRGLHASGNAVDIDSSADSHVLEVRTATDGRSCLPSARASATT